MKRCSKCGLEKLSSGFARDSKTADGLRYDCKECTSKVTPKGPIELVDPTAVWATKKMKDDYWPQMGEWLMGDRNARPTG